jgi:hypothetical protein
MSFLFGAKPALSSAEKIAAAETEIEMVSDMFNRFVQTFWAIVACYPSNANVYVNGH